MRNCPDRNPLKRVLRAQQKFRSRKMFLTSLKNHGIELKNLSSLDHTLEYGYGIRTLSVPIPTYGYGYVT